MLGAQRRRRQPPRASEVSGLGGRYPASQGPRVWGESRGFPKAAGQPGSPFPGVTVGGGGTLSPLHAGRGAEGEGGAFEA